MHTHADGTLFVRTYERGVQGLTQSCGTGSMSCAALLQRCGSVHVTTPGDKLEITILSEGIELVGKAAAHYSLEQSFEC